MTTTMPPRPDVTAEPVRIIAGSGRSGTTWILDALAEANSLRPVFEPLHPRAVPEASRFAYQYFRPETRHVAAEDYLARVFDGSFHTWWTDYRVRPDRLRPSWSEFRSLSTIHRYVRRWRKVYIEHRRCAPIIRRPRLLVKVIRANLMLAWLRARFHARIALVIRHPGAVVESRLRLGGDDWDPHVQLAHYLHQADLQQDYLFKYTHLLHRPLSDAEAHTAIWYIENQLPLTQLSSSQATVAFYEDLLGSSVAPWRAILDALDLEHMPDTKLLSSPSQSAETRSGAALGTAHLARWRERLDSATLDQIGSMLKALDVTIYDVDDPMPRADALPQSPNLAQPKRMT